MNESLPQRAMRIGRSIMPSGHGSSSASRSTSIAPTPLSTVATVAQSDEENNKRKVVNGEPQRPEVQRTIRFPDEEQAAASKVGSE